MERACGTWPSPITAAAVAAQGLRLSSVAVDGGDIYWLEGRPEERGRYVLVRHTREGTIADVTPAPFNVRSRVHEYGGGAYVVSRGVAYFSHFDDQRLYRTAVDDGDVLPITPAGRWFYADLQADAARERLICVREDHTAADHEPVNALVAVPAQGGADPGHLLVSGDDFYSSPRLSPDGRQLAWLSWRHPRMPWDGTELWVASFTSAGTLGPARPIAGGPSESVYQPGWGDDGALYFASDRDGWWRLYTWQPDGRVAPLLRDPPVDAEFGRPEWVFGTATWACAGDRRLVTACTRRGIWQLGLVDTAAATWHPLATDLQPNEWLTATPTHAVVVAGSSHTADAVVTIELATGVRAVLRSASATHVDPKYLSTPEAISFSTAGDETAHAFYYPPRHPDCVALSGERPPLIVITHGGPTTATRTVLDFKVHFWTSRGFGVVDVNYRGSSGYGRGYRTRLNGSWGIADVDDVVSAARDLVGRGLADPNRLIVRGGSAGGYTTLAALVFHPGAFAAGASYYGISDVEVLARDTHKFESRYLDSLIGPYPEARDEYRARSPIHVIDRLASALILFQGLEDHVVPPNQSEMMAAAARSKGLPVAYLAFEGEQHGFRRADTIIRSLEAELFFYGQVFGFTPADRLAPIAIDNLA